LHLKLIFYLCKIMKEFKDVSDVNIFMEISKIVILIYEVLLIKIIGIFFVIYYYYLKF